MRLLHLFIKDIKVIVYDVKTLAIIMLMPIVLMSILGMSLNGVFSEESESGILNSKIGVVPLYNMDEELYKVAGKVDLSEYDQDLVTALNPEASLKSMLSNEEIKDILDSEWMDSERAEVAMDQGQIDGILYLPKDFVYNHYMTLAGSRIKSELTLVTDPDKQFIGDIISTIFKSYTDTVNHIFARNRVVTSSLMTLSQEALDGIKGLEFEKDDLQKGIVLKVQTVDKKESVNSFQYYAAAIMCMFLLYAAGVGGRALLEERKDHTLLRLKVTGMGMGAMVLSNYFRILVLVILQSGVMIIYSSLVLKVKWGSMIHVVTAVVLSGFAIGAMGAFISVVTLILDNYKVANAFEFGLVYVMALVGGSYIPVEMLPAFFRKIDFISINGQALKIYIGGMYQLPLNQYLPQILNMILFGFIFIVMTLGLIKWKGERLA